MGLALIETGLRGMPAEGLVTVGRLAIKAVRESGIPTLVRLVDPSPSSLPATHDLTLTHRLATLCRAMIADANVRHDPMTMLPRLDVKLLQITALRIAPAAVPV